MQEFMREFTQLDGKMGKVVLNHCLFGKQVFYCDKLQTISDDKRVGLILKNQSIYVDKSKMRVVEVKDNTYEVSDDRLTITVIVNK